MSRASALTRKALQRAAYRSDIGPKDLREIQLHIDQMNRAQMAIDTMTDFEERKSRTRSC
jgi:hypothetical protein